MTSSELVRLFLLFFAGMCILTIVIFIAYILFACVCGLYDKRTVKTREMHVVERDGVEVEEVV